MSWLGGSWRGQKAMWSLVRVAEREGVSCTVTIDKRHFSIYRPGADSPSQRRRRSLPPRIDQWNTVTCKLLIAGDYGEALYQG